MPDQLEQDLIDQIRQGDEAAWRHLIDQYEGRLLAFARSRIKDRSQAEDIVQNTFIGFLTSLPNYEPQRASLESFLFRIAAYKITDCLRQQGKRSGYAIDDQGMPLAGTARRASSLARSREGTEQKKQQLQEVLEPLIQQWIREQNYERLKCCELLFVRGAANKQVAEQLNISEQDVANHKQALMKNLKTISLG